MSTIRVTGGHRSDALPASTVVADDHEAIKRRHVGQPVEYTTSDGVTVAGVVTAIEGLSLIVALPESEEDYPLTPKPLWAAGLCFHDSTTDVGTEPDGSTIVECDSCGDRWNEGV